MPRKPMPLDQIVTLLDHFTRATEDGSELVGVLVPAAVLENNLMTLLRSFLIKDGATLDDIYKGDGPLSSYSKCARMAYCLGFVSTAMYTNLDLIGQIRNRFAHSTKPITFKDAEVEKLCKRLVFTSPIAVLAHPWTVSVADTEQSRIDQLKGMETAFNALGPKSLTEAFDSADNHTRFKIAAGIAVLWLLITALKVKRQVTILQ